MSQGIVGAPTFMAWRGLAWPGLAKKCKARFTGAQSFYIERLLYNALDTQLSWVAWLDADRYVAKWCKASLTVCEWGAQVETF